MSGNVTLRYHEYKHWSPMLGQDAARVWMFDQRGSEFFMVIPDDGGKAYRERRATAVEAIYTAIENGCEPGEVHVL